MSYRANNEMPIRRDKGSDMVDFAITKPDMMVSVREVFGIETDLRVPAFSTRDDHVPEIDHAYRFNPEVTLAILAGFAQDRRTMIQGMHGTGKSTHIEQVAARLNWPCVRVNLDGHLSRLDLVGKDTIVIRMVSKLPNSKKGLFLGHCNAPSHLSLMNTMLEGPMSCS